ncbi:hypothetical protein [Spirosoma validum]|uniref:Uncharacterized protein n=1 Tax=Spirosoma validum TaxID=2771355 RepID=A0A927GH58_9BACT|nr:hypothetical protein [Spirosoma validum]MBD2757330.1 hypothetical protein [Spirosoma validum]
MTELSFDYWNKLAGQFIVISSLLGGFSLSVIIPLIEAKSDSKIMNYVFRSVVIATASFLISIFAMTKILMVTSQGFPFKVSSSALSFPRIVGFASFIVGLLAIIAVLSLSGWLRSHSMKRFTIIVGLLTLLLIFAMIV